MPERSFPFAMAQVLEANLASLQNLGKQKYEIFNQFSVYEHTIPLPEINDSSKLPISVREISRADRTLFKEIENKLVAQVLYKMTVVEQAVPENLYKAIAEILAYVYSFKRKGMNV